MAVAGHLVLGVATFRATDVISPGMIVAWAWTALVFLAVFPLTGRGRRLAGSWQCPECRLFQPPTTLVCPCGTRHPEARQLV